MALPSMVESNWKSMAHTTLGASAMRHALAGAQRIFFQLGVGQQPLVEASVLLA